MERGKQVSAIVGRLPPSLYSLLQPLEEHAGRLKMDNFDLIFVCDTLNISSWFPFQP